jgi:3-hydroxybutyryl-CoA dehydratase
MSRALSFACSCSACHAPRIPQFKNPAKNVKVSIQRVMLERRMSMPHRAEDWIGKTAARRVRITDDLIDQFTELSGDNSPIHVTDGAAQSRGFPTRVAHGMLLGSLVSGVVGRELPGEHGVLHEVQLSFRNSCHPGDEIIIRVTVSEFFESVQALVLKVQIERADGVTLATGRVQSGLR